MLIGPDKSNLCQHVESIHDGIIHICEYCDHKATIKGSICQHMQSVHNDGKHSCDYKETDKSNLYQHVESIHDGVIYSCEYCDHKATTKSSLCHCAVHPCQT